MVLRGIHVHPVKSLGGCAVAEAEVDALGLVGDRRFLVVDPEGRFLTQRTLPRMALIATRLDAATLTLTAAGAGSVEVPRAPDPAAPLVAVTVWKSEGLLAEDCGSAAAAWLGRLLGAPCRLVRIGPAFRRPVRRGPASNSWPSAVIAVSRCRRPSGTRSGVVSVPCSTGGGVRWT